MKRIFFVYIGIFQYIYRVNLPCDFYKIDWLIVRLVHITWDSSIRSIDSIEQIEASVHFSGMVQWTSRVNNPPDVATVPRRILKMTPQLLLLIWITNKKCIIVTNIFFLMLYHKWQRQTMNGSTLHRISEQPFYDSERFVFENCGVNTASTMAMMA